MWSSRCYTMSRNGRLKLEVGRSQSSCFAHWKLNIFGRMFFFSFLFLITILGDECSKWYVDLDLQIFTVLD